MGRAERKLYSSVIGDKKKTSFLRNGNGIGPSGGRLPLIKQKVEHWRPPPGEPHDGASSRDVRSANSRRRGGCRERSGRQRLCRTAGSGKSGGRGSRHPRDARIHGAADISAGMLRNSISGCFFFGENGFPQQRQTLAPADRVSEFIGQRPPFLWTAPGQTAPGPFPEAGTGYSNPA